MKIIGVTGGSGAGKSAVLEVWKGLGANVIDADEVYHRVLKTDPTLLREIDERFPGMVTNGVLNRAALAKTVFADKNELAALNKITHKYVIAAIKTKLSELRKAGAQTAVIDAIYLIESELFRECDVTVAVTAPLDIRLKRITARDGIKEKAALARIRSQQNDEYYIDGCDKVLTNSGDANELRKNAHELYFEII